MNQNRNRTEPLAGFSNATGRVFRDTNVGHDHLAPPAQIVDLLAHRGRMFAIVPGDNRDVYGLPNREKNCPRIPIALSTIS
jgi:hypothetical protein